MFQNLQKNDLKITVSKEKSTLWKKTKSFFSSEVDESQSIRSKAGKMKSAISSFCLFMYEKLWNFPYLSLIPSFGFLSLITKLLQKSSSNLSSLFTSIKSVMLIFTHAVLKTIAMVFNGLTHLYHLLLSICSLLLDHLSQNR